MSATHTSWMAHAQASNKKEQARVSKKYKGVKKTSVDLNKFDSDADPFMENDPVTDDMEITRRHDAKQYARAAAVSVPKARKILKETDTLLK
jgi:hypothetical protein